MMESIFDLPQAKNKTANNFIWQEVSMFDEKSLNIIYKGFLRFKFNKDDNNTLYLCFLAPFKLYRVFYLLKNRGIRQLQRV